MHPIHFSSIAHDFVQFDKRLEKLSFCAFCTHHFFDLSLGGGFLGIRKSARIGCMSQSAEKDTRSRQQTKQARRRHFKEGKKKKQDSGTHVVLLQPFR